MEYNTSIIAEYSPIFPEISYLENEKKMQNKIKIRPPAPIFFMIQDAQLKIFLRGLIRYLFSSIDFLKTGALGIRT